MKAKDLMIEVRKCLRPDNTIKEAVNMLKTDRNGPRKREIDVLPVVDQAGTIVGILSVHDILRAVHPFYLSMSETNLGNFTWDGMAESLARQAGNKIIGAFMTREIASVRENDSLMECVSLMMKRNVHQLPVIDEKGKISGMIYEKDIFSAITDVMLDKDNPS